jgi:hypothetical protein
MRSIVSCRFIGYSVLLGLMAALVMVTTSCPSTSIPMSTPVPTPTISSIKVSPSVSPNLAVGSTQQFTATATYSNGSTADITTQATWSSSDNTVITISSGLARGLAAGIASITADLSGVASPPVSLAAAAPKPALSSINVSPAVPANLSVGSTQQFAATATYSNGSTADITVQATWASSDNTVTTVSSGSARGVSTGVSRITADLSGVTSTPVSLTVVAPEPPLSSIKVSPAVPANLEVGSTQQFTATATYSDGSTADITTQATWSSSNKSVLTMSSGLGSGAAPGASSVAADLSGVTSPPVTLTVIARSIVNGASSDSPVGQTRVAPAVYSIKPVTGGIGTLVTINGAGFYGGGSSPAVTAVTVGGVAAASYAVGSDTEMTAVVGSGATGRIAVITPGGTGASSAFFTYARVAPTVDSFKPVSGGAHTSVTITGAGFYGGGYSPAVTGVTFGGVAAESFFVGSDSWIRAVVGSGASGRISVTTPGGKEYSSGVFTYAPSALP